MIRTVAAWATACVLAFPAHAGAAEPEENPYGVPMTEPVEGAAPGTGGPLGLPPKPAFSGNGLLISAGAVSAVSLALRLAAIGVGAPLADGCDLGDDDCERSLRSVQGLTYAAPSLQAVASGLVIPGGLLHGKYDAWRWLATGHPDHTGRSFVVAGAFLFGFFTAASIAARPAFVVGCTRSTASLRRCNTKATYVGYSLAIQASDMLSTAGLGLLTYGLAYRRHRGEHGVVVVPFSQAGARGFAVAGSF